MACFGNAAAHLEPGGCFVVELRVPELRRLPPGRNVLPWQVSPERSVFYSYDYVSPAELDLMARLAG